MALDHRVSRQGGREPQEGDGVSAGPRALGGGGNRMRMASLSLGIVGSLFTSAASAQVPAAIAAPGESALVTLHAEGAQVYACKAGNDGKLAWAFREPIATLLLDGKSVGRHFVGPSWEHV